MCSKNAGKNKSGGPRFKGFLLSHPKSSLPEEQYQYLKLVQMVMASNLDIKVFALIDGFPENLDLEWFLNSDISFKRFLIDLFRP